MFRPSYSIDGDCNSLNDQIREIIQKCCNINQLNRFKENPYKLENLYEIFLNIYCHLTELNRIKFKLVSVFFKKQISLVTFNQLKGNDVVHIFSTRVLNKMFNEMSGKAILKIEDENNDEVVLKKITRLNNFIHPRYNDDSCSANKFKMTAEILNTLIKIIVCADFAAYEYFDFMNSKSQKKINVSQFLFSIITKHPSYEINKKVYEYNDNKLLDMHFNKEEEEEDSEDSLSP